jgi:hypothetical protein
VSVLLAAPATPTVPGVEVTSADGRLTAVVHDGFPGVLLRVRVPGVREASVWRSDGSAWVPVRSGSPLIVSTGEGHAYDAEVAPGAAVVYALDRSDPVSMVAVRMPAVWPRDSAAWLVSAEHPSLARMIIAGRPLRRTRGLQVSRTDLVGALASGRRLGSGSDEWSLTVQAWDERERDAIDELLDSGPLLWHPQESMQSPLAHSWLLVESAEWEQVGGQGTWAHLATLGVTQVARPAVTTTDPLRIPGCGWHESVAGLTDAAAYASAYPTTWDQLKAGVAGWTQ